MLPNFIVIGAQKCGTTSLHFYLSQHPQIFMSGKKELNFFNTEPKAPRDLDWYKQQFSGDRARQSAVRGESSPSYTNAPFYQDTARRMAAVLPEAKLIYVVGDPLKRVVSSYLHHYTYGKEHLEFASAMESVLTGENGTYKQNYLLRSRYYFQLSQFLPFYPKERILLVAREDLWEKRNETLREIFRFLEVDENFTCRKFERVIHRTAQRRRKTPLGMRLAKTAVIQWMKTLPNDIYYRGERFLFYPWSHTVARPYIPEELRERILDALRDDVRELRQYSGKQFEQWCL